MSITTMTFAARDFSARRSASDEHTPQESVRSEQRSLAEKELSAPQPGFTENFARARRNGRSWKSLFSAAVYSWLLAFRWLGTSSAYVLEVTEDLSGGMWTPVTQPLFMTNGVTKLTVVAPNWKAFLPLESELNIDSYR